MKKFLVLVICALMLMCCVGCNMSCGPGSYEYKKVHVDTYHHDVCLNVISWVDSDSGIEVKTKEAGSIFLSEGTYIMIHDLCPFCGE